MRRGNLTLEKEDENAKNKIKLKKAHDEASEAMRKTVNMGKIDGAFKENALNVTVRMADKDSGTSLHSYVKVALAPITHDETLENVRMRIEKELVNKLNETSSGDSSSGASEKQTKFAKLAKSKSAALLLLLLEHSADVLSPSEFDSITFISPEEVRSLQVEADVTKQLERILEGKNVPLQYTGAADSPKFETKITFLTTAQKTEDKGKSKGKDKEISSSNETRRGRRRKKTITLKIPAMVSGEAKEFAAVRVQLAMRRSGITWRVIKRKAPDITRQFLTFSKSQNGYDSSEEQQENGLSNVRSLVNDNGEQAEKGDKSTKNTNNEEGWALDHQLDREIGLDAEVVDGNKSASSKKPRSGNKHKKRMESAQAANTAASKATVVKPRSKGNKGKKSTRGAKKRKMRSRDTAISLGDPNDSEKIQKGNSDDDGGAAKILSDKKKKKGNRVKEKELRGEKRAAEVEQKNEVRMQKKEKKSDKIEKEKKKDTEKAKSEADNTGVEEKKKKKKKSMCNIL